MQEIIVTVIVTIAVAMALRWAYRALSSSGNPCHGCSGCHHAPGKGGNNCCASDASGGIRDACSGHYGCKCDKKEEKKGTNE